MCYRSRHRLPLNTALGGLKTFIPLKFSPQRSWERVICGDESFQESALDLLSTSTSGIPSCHPCREFSRWCNTVEPRFNEPLYNEVLGITNDFLQPGQNYRKMYGTEPRFNEILVITNTIHKRKREIYLDLTNKCQHEIKDECQTDQQG